MEKVYWDANLKKVIEETLGCEITEEGLKRITTIEADKKGIYKLDGLQYCTNLAVLRLPKNLILNLGVLQNLVNLRELDLTNNGTSMSIEIGQTEGHFYRPDPADADVMPFSPEIWQRYDSGQGDWVGPQPSYEMRNIKLGNIIRGSLEPLSKLFELRKLELAENEVSYLGHLENLSLEYLGLRKNRIYDLQQLLKFEKLSPGCRIDLRGNSFSTMGYDQEGVKENYAAISKLEEKGIEVLDRW